jgi:hypothetical protein
MYATDSLLESSRVMRNRGSRFAPRLDELMAMNVA